MKAIKTIITIVAGLLITSCIDGKFASQKNKLEKKCQSISQEEKRKYRSIVGYLTGSKSRISGSPSYVNPPVLIFHMVLMSAVGEEKIILDLGSGKEKREKLEKILGAGFIHSDSEILVGVCAWGDPQIGTLNSLVKIEENK